MEDCLFCKIVRGEIPVNIIFEDEATIAFLDLSQITDGHTLVVPKTHSRNLLEASEDIVGSLMGTVSKVSELMSKNLNTKGFNIISNINEEAGQSVFHTHIHIIPRYNKDEFDYNYEKKETNLESLSKLKNKLINNN